MTQYYADFNSMTTGAELAADAQWTDSYSGGTWGAAVTVDGTTTNGKSVVVDDGGWGDDGQRVICDAIAATTGDIEILFRQKITSTTGLSTVPCGATLASSTDSNDYYAAYFTGTTGTWRIGYWQNGSFWATVGSGVNIWTPVVDTYFFIRLARSGTTIRAKVWAGAIGDEPGSWQLSGTDTTLGSVVGALIYTDSGPTPYTVDYIGVADSGDAAPSSAGGGGDPEGSLTLNKLLGGGLLLDGVLVR